MAGTAESAAAPRDEITVRPVREADAEAVWRISQQRGVLETILALPSERIEDRTARLRALGPDSHWFVAVADGPAGERVIGLAGLDVGRGRLRHSGHIFIFVDKEYHGQGAGTKLMGALLDVADNWLLLRRVELTVFVSNERAKHLYERLGFVVEGVRKMSVISEGALKDEYLMARYR